MIRIIIFTILSLIAARFIGMMFGSETPQNKKEVTYFITAEKGAIGCLSKDKFLEEEGYYKSEDFKAAQRLLDDQECFFFVKGTKLFADEGTCSKADKDEDLFPFKPNEFMLLQPYLPCASVR